MPSERMISKKDDGVGWMILNNPERHNAISLEMWDAALEIMADFAADPSVRVMVVTGAGGKSGLDRPAGAGSQLRNRLRDGQLLGGNLCNHCHGVIGWGEGMTEPVS